MIPGWAAFMVGWAIVIIAAIFVRRGAGCTVEVVINDVHMRQIAGTLDEALRSICHRWNSSTEHRAVATLSSRNGRVFPEMAPGIEHVNLKIRIRD